MKTICTTESIVQLLNDSDSVVIPDMALPYKQVFPFEYIPDTVVKAQTFICFDVDVVSVSGKTFLTPALYVWIFTHKSKLRLASGGVRTDLIASELDKILNGSRYFGLGELDLHTVSRFVPIADYQGRTLTYRTREFNRSGSKKPPPNRKA